MAASANGTIVLHALSLAERLARAVLRPHFGKGEEKELAKMLQEHLEPAKQAVREMER